MTSTGGVLSEAEAKKLALESVGRSPLRNNDYFFIYDARNIAVAHADRSMLGREHVRGRAT